jgi:pilus assembly protein CpaE
MKDLAATILVEPLAEHREALVPVLGTSPAVRLAAVATDYDQLASLLAAHPVRLVVLGLDADIGRALDLVRSLVATRPDLAVLPVSRVRDAETILRSLRAGAREFVALPAQAGELAAAIDRLLADRPSVAPSASPTEPARGACAAVIGATGGVGTTTLAVNLATIVARASGRDVALADLDPIVGIADVCLDLVPDQTLADLASNASRLDPTLLKRSLTRHADSGLYVLPAPRTLDQALKLEPDAIRSVLDQLLAQFPVVLFDLSKSLQASDSLALELADTILMVVQLEPGCLRNSSRMLDLFRLYDGLADKVRIVANRVGSSPLEITVKKAEDILGLPVSWQIGNAFRLFDAARSRGQPLDAEAAGSKPHRALLDIARSVFPQAMEAEPRRSRFGKFAASFF